MLIVAFVIDFVKTISCYFLVFPCFPFFFSKLNLQMFPSSSSIFVNVRWQSKVTYPALRCLSCKMYLLQRISKSGPIHQRESTARQNIQGIRKSAGRSLLRLRHECRPTHCFPQLAEHIVSFIFSTIGLPSSDLRQLCHHLFQISEHNSICRSNATWPSSV